MKLWFVIDSAPFTADMLQRLNTDALGGGVGGAETMTVGLARHLSELGHEVTIWATQCEAPGQYDEVRWRRIEHEFRHALIHEPAPDVCISVRRPEIFTLPEFHGLSSLRVLWAQDVFHSGWYAHFSACQAIIYVSEWQQQAWVSRHPPLEDVPSWVTRVAFDRAWLAPEAPRYRRRCTYVYASRPERGLQPVLEMWPQIRARVPLANLLVTGYTQGVDVERADALIGDTDGVEIARSDDKPGQFRAMARASLLLYPGEVWFEETNGSIASQAMAAGVIPLVSRRGALPETVPESAGVLFDGDPRDPVYQTAFVAEVVRLSQPLADAEVEARQRVGRWFVENCDYADVAASWDATLRQWLGVLV
jgi:glycosyltransferase involved in cell wall biosynthesis